VELLDRKIVRIPLYGLFTLVVFLAALVLTFPDERVKQIVIVQAEQALNAGKRADAGDRIWEVRIDDLDLWWFTGIELDNVRLKERWTDEKKARVEAEVAEGAPPQEPLTVTIPRVAGRVSILKSIINLGLGAQYDVDFEDGGLISGEFVQNSDGGRFTANFADVDMYKASILQSVTGVPGFGTLEGDVEIEIDPKTRRPIAGNIDLKGKKLTVGPATVKTEMLPSMAYLEVPQTNFGTFVLKAKIVKDKGSQNPSLEFDEFSAKGRDVRMEVWGDVELSKVFSRGMANVSMRLQFDAEFVKENSLSPVLNIQLFRSGKSSDDWYGIAFTGLIGKMKPKGSVAAARGPSTKKGATNMAGGDDEKADAGDKGASKTTTKNVRPKRTPKALK
jgi:type II secretion system protein N